MIKKEPKFLEMTSAEFRRRFITHEPEPKKNKYHAVKTEVNGVIYDSKKESRRGQYLEELQKFGKIKELERQKRFQLIEPFNYHGKKYQGVTWVADFYYFDNEKGKYIAEDVKSKITRKKAEYRIKIKLFMLKYPKILFSEVL
jgi:hypothetical protein